MRRPAQRLLTARVGHRRVPSGAPRAIAPFLAALTILLLVPSPARAQEFGRWSWEAILGLGGRSRDTLRDGEAGSTLDERNLGLALGLNGFIAHPAVSRFRLGVDLQFTDTDAGGSLDTDRLGLNGDVEIFPRSPYRGSLHFNRQLYDYSGVLADDPFAVFASPDTLTSYGGRFRAARGFLGGSLLGFDRNSVDFLGAGTEDHEYEREFYDWSRDTADFSHHLRLEHRFRNLGTVDVEYDELRLNLDERGDFSPDLHWTLTGSAVRQESDNFGLGRQQIDDYQLRSRITHDLRDRDVLDVFYEFGTTRPDTRADTESHGLAVSYKWRPNEMWHLGPTASYAWIASDPERIRSPRAGFIAGWDWRRAAWNSAFTAQSTYGVVQREMAGTSQDESQLSGSVIGTLGHGDAEGLRKEFELEFASNRLRVTQSGLIPPPGLGLPLPGLGAEDVQRARVSLGHRWDSQYLNAWSDWNRRATIELTTNQEVVTETITAAVQYGAHRFDLKANLAASDVEQVSTGDQSIRSFSVGAVWRPSRSVLVRGSYRFDERRIALAPDIDGNQIEAGIRLHIGLLDFDAAFIQSDQRLAGGPEVTIRSLTWTITRRFGGWLPIVSGPGRRGVIR